MTNDKSSMANFQFRALELRIGHCKLVIGYFGPRNISQQAARQLSAVQY
jgi:hypothetical protein